MKTLLNARGAPPPLDDTFAPERSVYLESFFFCALCEFRGFGFVAIKT